MLTYGCIFQSLLHGLVVSFSRLEILFIKEWTHIFCCLSIPCCQRVKEADRAPFVLTSMAEEDVETRLFPWKEVTTIDDSERECSHRQPKDTHLEYWQGPVLAPQQDLVREGVHSM